MIVKTRFLAGFFISNIWLRIPAMIFESEKLAILNECAAYILAERLHEATQEGIRISKAKKLPILERFANDDALYEAARTSLHNFLTEAAQGRAEEAVVASVQNWKKNVLSGVDELALELTDVIGIHSVRKQVMLNFIPELTQDVHKVIKMATAFEDFFSFAKQETFKAYLEIQHTFLQRQKDFADSIINNNINGIISFDKALCVTTWNNLMEHISGQKHSDVIGRPMYEVFKRYWDKDLEKALLAVVAGKPVADNTLPVFQNHGRYYEVSLASLYLLGKVEGGICIVNDVTEKKAVFGRLKEYKEEVEAVNEELREQLNQMEEYREVVQESERKFRLLAENSTDLISTHTPEGYFTYASPASKALVGYEPEELLGISFYEFVHPSDLADVQRKHMAVVETGQVQNVIFRALAKNGSYTWLESTAKAILNAATGRLEEFQVSSKEVNARIEVEKQLEKEREFLKAILENAGDGILACDAIGNLSFYNKSAKLFYRLDKKGIKPNIWMQQVELYQPDGKTLYAAHEIPLLRALKGEYVKDQEVIVKSASGKIRNLLVNAQPILKARGEIQGAVSVMRDVTESNETRNNLVRSEALLSEAQAISHLGSWEWDVNTHETVWSDEMYKILGYEPGEIPVTYKTYIEHVHPEDRTNLSINIADAYATHVPYRLNHRIIRKDKKERWLLAQGKITFNNAGKPQKLTATVLDVTAQKEAELQLRESQDFIQKITDASPDIIFVYDLVSKRTVFSNREIYQVIGYSPDDIKTMDAESNINLIHPHDQVAYEKFYEDFATAKEKEVHEQTYRVKSKSGQWLTFLTRATLFKRSESGVPVQVVGISQDITERLKAEDQVRYREQQLIEAQTIARVGSFDVNLDDNTLLGTPEFFRIFGLPITSERINTEDVWNLVHPDDVGNLREAFDEAVRFNNTFDLEFRILTHSGKVVHVAAKCKPVEGEPGTARRVIGTIMDISDRKMAELELTRKSEAILNAYKQLEAAQEQLRNINNDLERRVHRRTEELYLKNRELEATNEELRKINVDLDNFIYTASHDLRAPISNVEGLVNVFARRVAGKIDDKEKQLIEMINTSINKFKKTINDLTRITKAQKEAEEEIEPLHFKDMLNNVKEDIQQSIRESGVKIETDFNVEVIHYASKNLRSIMYNLLSNAIKYRDPERPLKVKIRTWREDHFIVMSVQDNGLGIRTDQLHKLFTMFKRLHTHVEGSGVGLYIVKRIIENNKGKIKVESKEGEGTTFSVYFNLFR